MTGLGAHPQNDTGQTSTATQCNKRGERREAADQNHRAEAAFEGISGRVRSHYAGMDAATPKRASREPTEAMPLGWYELDDPGFVTPDEARA